MVKTIKILLVTLFLAAAIVIFVYPRPMENAYVITVDSNGDKYSHNKVCNGCFGYRTEAQLCFGIRTACVTSDKVPYSEKGNTLTRPDNKDILRDQLKKAKDEADTKAAVIDSPDCIEAGEYVDVMDKETFECCGDMVKVQASPPMDDDCEYIIPEGSPGYEPGWTCLACGDGLCDQTTEDKCLCPEDCSE